MERAVADGMLRRRTLGARIKERQEQFRGRFRPQRVAQQGCAGFLCHFLLRGCKVSRDQQVRDRIAVLRSPGDLLQLDLQRRGDLLLHVVCP